MKYYTGVGSRNTPDNIKGLMVRIARWMKERNWMLRTGDARGADAAFAEGAGEDCEMFFAHDATTEAALIARQFHPAWNKMSDHAQKLHARNAFQVLGRDLKTPSNILICWTPDGCSSHSSRSIRTGGTGTAISIASENGIPVYNLADMEALLKIQERIGER